MITKYQSKILNDIELLTLEEVNQAIEELTTKMDKVLFGSHYRELLEILNTLKRHVDDRSLWHEISRLKQDIHDYWSVVVGKKTANVLTFQTWVRYQNELKGPEFVRDSLKKEITMLTENKAVAE